MATNLIIKEPLSSEVGAASMAVSWEADTAWPLAKQVDPIVADGWLDVCDCAHWMSVMKTHRRRIARRGPPNALRHFAPVISIEPS